MKKKKAKYVAPEVELMEARVERGFAGSGNEPGWRPSELEPVTPAEGPGSDISDDFIGR